MSASQTDKVYDFLAEIARHGLPMPRDYAIALAAGCAIGGAAMCMTVLRRTNRITVESEGSGTSARRRVFVAGHWSDWTNQNPKVGKYDGERLPQIRPEHDAAMRGVRFEDVRLRRPLAVARRLAPPLAHSPLASSLQFAAT